MVGGVLLPRALASLRRLLRRQRRDTGAISSRGHALVAHGHGPPSYIAEHISRLGEVYCPEERPDGYICLAISEHRLAYPLFSAALAEVRPAGVQSTGYDNPRGGLRFRQSVAAFLSEHVAGRAGSASAQYARSRWCC